LKVAKEAATSPQLLQHIDKSIAEWLKVENYEEAVTDTYPTHQMIGPNSESVTVSTKEQHNQLTAQGYTMEGK